MCTLFPGAMGPDGFISCFDHLMPKSQLKRRIILKGGPGVGKSTFMRRLHASLCSGQEPSTLYFCSGDPDSLDAAAINHAGLLILDGTAPHSIDPKVPGARDSIVNLGVCLNEEALRPRLHHILACMDDHAACCRRARAHLKAAQILRQDNAAIVHAFVDPAQLARMTRALIQAITAAGAPCSDVPDVRRVITDAVTPKGELCLIPENARGRVIRLTARSDMDLSCVLTSVSQALCAAGYAVWMHLDPRSPGALLHLTIPELDTLVTTCDLLPSEQTYDFSACISPGSLLRHECMLEQGRAAIQMHMQQAVCALGQAKQLHDELETFYVPNMDFGRWQQIFDETLSALTPAQA